MAHVTDATKYWLMLLALGLVIAWLAIDQARKDRKAAEEEERAGDA